MDDHVVDARILQETLEAPHPEEERIDALTDDPVLGDRPGGLSGGEAGGGVLLEDTGDKRGCQAAFLVAGDRKSVV